MGFTQGASARTTMVRDTLDIRTKRPLCVGGFVPCSTQDWPDQLAAVVFLRGCPWRCIYCHNPHLQTRDWADDRAWEDILIQLEARRGLLDGVVFSGGEPTADAALPEAITAIQALGLQAGLHTAGSYPKRLAPLLGQLAWVGLDIKADIADYPAITGVPDSGEAAWESLRLIQNAGIPFEVRITAHPDWLPQEKLHALIAKLREQGVKHPVLQAARPTVNIHCASAGRYFEKVLEQAPADARPVLRAPISL